jgi:hypothetical protein
VRDADKIRADFIRRNIERAIFLTSAARAELDRGIRAQRLAEALRIVAAFQPYLDWHHLSIPAEQCIEFQAKIKELSHHLRAENRVGDAGVASARRIPGLGRLTANNPRDA